MKASDYMTSGTSYLSAKQLKQIGKDLYPTIRGVEVVEFDDGDRLCLQFEKTETGVILNKTRLAVLVDAYGDETDDWIGREIRIYPGKTSFGGNTVDCINIEAKRPPQPEDTGGGFDDDIPF